MRIEERRTEAPGKTTDQLLGEIRDYCRDTKTAESTFGRVVVNDGKLVPRLRDGARITTGTLDKVRAFLSEHRSGIPTEDICSGRQNKQRRQDRRAGRYPSRRIPVFRQSAEIPAVRLHLQREDRRRQPDFA